MAFNPVQNMRDVQHFGEEGGVVPVVDVAATSTFLQPKDMERAFDGEMAGCYLYSRHKNPSVHAFGKKLAAMEGLEAGLGVASGMAAVNCAIQQLMPAGGHVVSSRMVYGGTYALFKNILPRCGIEVTFVDTTDLAAINKAITPKTRVIYTETMSNPMLEVADLAAIRRVCDQHGLQLVVDNTFTPLVVTPGRLGADVVLYSCTKYISGASDLIAGAILGSQQFIDQLIDLNAGMVMLTGPAMDARIAHELYLRLEHLPLRIAAHSKTALQFAQAVARAGVPTIYPGLPEHKGHAILEKIRNPAFGHGGMVAIDLLTHERAFDLATRLQENKFGLYAVSLGFSRTLMSCPAVTTSSEIPEAEQQLMGLSPGLLRLSLGFTGDDAVMTQRFLDSYKLVP